MVTLSIPSKQSSVIARSGSIVILDYGSQYTRLIARRVRELNVFCEIVHYDISEEEGRALDAAGFILSGGPGSVYTQEAPQLPEWILASGKPILGICYGMQLLVEHFGGRVTADHRREYGPALIESGKQDSLFNELAWPFTVWMSHGDSVSELPPNARVTAVTHDGKPVAIAMGNRYGIQFHPEVSHTSQGKKLLDNFVTGICGCRADWTSTQFVRDALVAIKSAVGTDEVVMGVSGGVDSSVAACLINQAIGSRLHCIFVNNGLLRLDEEGEVVALLKNQLGLNVHYVDASERFLSALVGVTDPEVKRQVIGHTFGRLFEEEASKFSNARFLAQGTLYPDVIESAAPEAKGAVKIKTHHNVGGLPADLNLGLIEPLRYLFKDEVRSVGRELGLPVPVIDRQPFPGPGLAVRMIGEVTKARLATLRTADAIVREEIEAAGQDAALWQYFAVLSGVNSVGVVGDNRSYGEVVVVRVVGSDDGMTADWAELPRALLQRISTRIVNEVTGTTRVVYDITTKPPSTIEWE